MIPLYRPPIVPELEQKMLECLRSGWWGYGPECHRLESRFVEHAGGWAVATSSCTAALHVAGRMLQVSSDDEVIVPAITFVSTPMAFRSCGFRIRVADVDHETLLLNEKTAKPLITNRTRAIVVVHLYGQKAPVEGLRDLCDERGISLVEDCAHRLDLDDKDRPLGDFACYSFNAVKEAPAGEGGLLWCRDERLENKGRALSNLGLAGDTWQRSANLQHGDYKFCSEIGLKLRLNDLAATMANVMLDNRHDLQEKRRAVFRHYERALQNCSPELSWLSRESSDSFLMYVLKIDAARRDRFRSEMATSGVATSIHYPSLSQHPLFREVDYSCPVAERVADQIVTLPCFPDMTRESMEKVTSTTVDSLRSLKTLV